MNPSVPESKADVEIVALRYPHQGRIRGSLGVVEERWGSRGGPGHSSPRHKAFRSRILIQ